MTILYCLIQNHPSLMEQSGDDGKGVCHQCELPTVDHKGNEEKQILAHQH